MSQEIPTEHSIEASNDTPLVRFFKKILERLSLSQVLLIIIVVAGLLVTTAFTVYWNSQDRKYDIARPGQPNEDQSVVITDTPEDGMSAVDLAAVEKKLELLEKEQAVLSNVKSLSVSNLNDQNIRLTPNDQPSF